MKRTLLLLTALLLLVSAGSAEISFPEKTSAVFCYPEGTDPESAGYVYSCEYPLAAGDEETVRMINQHYAYLTEDAGNFTVPILGESADTSQGQAYTRVSGEVTCLNDGYVSIRIISESCLDGGEPVIILSSHTFPLAGKNAGTVASLPYVLGILDAGAEADEWLQERQAAKAEACIRRMVWERMQEHPPETLREDADEELLAAVFYPEDDFYLDQEGNLVFYVEPGMMADSGEGALLFSFDMDEILDEL